MIVEMDSYSYGYEEGYKAGNAAAYEAGYELIRDICRRRNTQLDNLENEIQHFETYFDSYTAEVFLALVRKWRGRPYDEEILKNIYDEIGEYDN